MATASKGEVPAGDPAFVAKFKLNRRTLADLCSQIETDEQKKEDENIEEAGTSDGGGALNITDPVGGALKPKERSAERSIVRTPPRPRRTLGQNTTIRNLLRDVIVVMRHL